MASTNKTTNYLLSQFVASDKPSWLADYNGDRLKIDTALKQLADDIDAVEVSIASLSSDVASNTSSINTLNTSVGTNTTDITDLKAQDIIIKNDITNLGTRVTALENAEPVEPTVEVRDISSLFPKANNVKATIYGKVVTLYIDGLTSVVSGSNSGVGQLPSDILPATNMNHDIVSANVGSRLRIYLPSSGAIGYYNYSSETGTIQAQFIITYIAQ